MTAAHYGEVLIMPPSFTGSSLAEVLYRLHYLLNTKRAGRITLDFTKCHTVMESGMVPLLPILDAAMAKHKTDFHIKLPANRELRNLFISANWAHYLDRARHPQDSTGSASYCPLLRFSNSAEQHDAVDRVLQVVFGAVDITKDGMKAIEWSVQEITDNVINHSKGTSTGYIQATWFKKAKVVEFVVADGGIGIAKSLGINDNKLALEKAIQEGVTRNKKTNQGNGLYGSFRIASVADGIFNIYSGFATLAKAKDQELHIRPAKIPYKGTVVRWSLHADRSEIISQALIFKGQSHDPAYDFVDQFHSESEGRVTVIMKQVMQSFGSREAGETARTYLRNLMANGAYSITIDFLGVNIISSSFADEVFGRMFVEMGPIAFMSRIKFENADREMMALINRAMVQRSGMAQA